jgi:23S rRNA (uracil1939-C5)-methyltransferase
MDLANIDWGAPMIPFEFKKHDVVDVEIVDLTHTGEGVGKVEGFTIFVEEGVPGDQLKVRLTTVKKHYALGEVMVFHEMSPLRQHPPCPYFGECGGCQIQNLRYEDQLQWKQHHVISMLQRLGNRSDAKDITKDILGMSDPYYYRNKAQYKISSNGKVGFYRKKTHGVVHLTKCIIQQEDGEGLIKSLEKVIRDMNLSIYDETTGKGAFRGIVQRISKATGKVMLILVWNGDDVTPLKEVSRRLAQENTSVTSIYANINKGKNNRIMGFENRLLCGDEKLMDTIGPIQFHLSPLSFFQVNNTMTEVIYQTVDRMLNLQGSETIFDLYCGMGTIGLYLANKAKAIYGIESVMDAVQDAKENARINGIHNVEFIHGKAEEAIFKLKERRIEPDSVILDPPRKGCEEALLQAVMEATPEKIVYVSCNPATLARDLKILAHKYNVLEVQPVDNFPHSMHVEAVVLMSRK